MASIEKITLRNYPILIAHEEPSMTKLIVDTLQQSGYTAFSVNSGQEWLAKLLTGRRQGQRYITFVDFDLLFDLVVSQYTGIVFSKQDQYHDRFTTVVDRFLVGRITLWENCVYQRVSEQLLEKFKRSICMLTSFHGCHVVALSGIPAPFEAFRNRLPARFQVPVLCEWKGFFPATSEDPYILTERIRKYIDDTTLCLSASDEQTIQTTSSRKAA